MVSVQIMARILKKYLKITLRIGRMSLKEKVTAELKDAMRSRDEVRLDAIRGIRAEIIKFEKSGKGEISDEDILKSIKTLIKERRELIDSSIKAGRDDIKADEEARVEVLQSYLPPALSSEELSAIVEKAVSSSGAETIKDMGKVMGAARKLVQESGKDADNKELSDLIKSRLS